jgi:hypothetical protein
MGAVHFHQPVSLILRRQKVGHEYGQRYRASNFQNKNNTRWRTPPPPAHDSRPRSPKALGAPLRWGFCGVCIRQDAGSGTAVSLGMIDEASEFHGHPKPGRQRIGQRECEACRRETVVDGAPLQSAKSAAPRLGFMLQA